VIHSSLFQWALDLPNSPIFVCNTPKRHAELELTPSASSDPFYTYAFMETMHSSKPDHASGRILNEKLSDKVPTGSCSPNTQTTHLSIDTLSAVHNGSASPATATRTPEGLTLEEITRSQHFTLRTLPGIPSCYL
jgi:hypothetical protein